MQNSPAAFAKSVGPTSLKSDPEMKSRDLSIRIEYVGDVEEADMVLLFIFDHNLATPASTVLGRDFALASLGVIWPSTSAVDLSTFRLSVVCCSYLQAKWKDFGPESPAARTTTCFSAESGVESCRRAIPCSQSAYYCRFCRFAFVAPKFNGDRVSFVPFDSLVN